jgi:hypothetical protein
MKGKWIRIRWMNGNTEVFNLDRYDHIVIRRDPYPEFVMEEGPDKTFWLGYGDLPRITDVHPLSDDPITEWVADELRELIRLACVMEEEEA